MNDPFHLERFVQAQNAHWESIRSELRNGDKRGHWMWFVFPQMKGLGSSSNAKYFGISCRAEAEAFLQHPILGPRLIECTQLVNGVEGRSALAIFGGIDAVKFRSSITLFAAVSASPEVFDSALAKYCGGHADSATLGLLQSAVGNSSPDLD